MITTILGATGNVGSKIADILQKKGEKVRVVARTADRLRPFMSSGGEVFDGDILDTEFLVKAFKGSDAVFTLIPPNYGAYDVLAYQSAVGESIAKAIGDAGVRYVVNLSSVGGELEKGTGPIVGLHNLEERLKRIKGLNVLNLRAAYFMENLLMNVHLIKSQGIMGSAMRGEVKFPMIATKDIARVAADYLLKREFKGTSVKYALGQRDVSMAEAAAIIGKKINKTDLKYVQFSYEDAEKGFVAAGLSPDMGRLYIEMIRAFNDMKVTVVRTKENTTPTTIEEFAETFASIYGEAKAA